MSESENGKKDPSPLPQEGEKGVLQAEARAEDEATTQQGEAVSATIWMGYGCFSMVCDRHSKAKIAEEFYARNALVQNPKMAQHNLSIYQECHDAHQYRRLARNSLFHWNRTVAAGSRVHLLSKNQLEEAN